MGLGSWSLSSAWDCAVEVTAMAYGITPQELHAPSRGRGPRPPKSAWEPKKVAVHLTVVITDCGYAELGRHLGLHRDTVASHCAWARSAMANDEQLEGLAHALKLRLGKRALSQREEGLSRPVDELIGTLRTMAGRWGANHPGPSSDITSDKSSDSSDKNPDHGNVITAPARRA